MKKMSNIRELREEQQRLRMRQLELEKAIHYDWRDVKESLRPKNVVKQVLAPVSEESEPIPELISELASHFTKKLIEKVPGHLGEWFLRKATGK
ncbi:MAG: hypothetical protein KGO92_10860 [Bacteroidota bacterium]|nr:hypothetical protein [Bacteroidota bacterium]